MIVSTEKNHPIENRRNRNKKNKQMFFFYLLLIFSDDILRLHNFRSFFKRYVQKKNKLHSQLPTKSIQVEKNR
jgi:hypothetical protein